MAKHFEFGKQAEEAACKYLMKKEYNIRERNYYFGKAEIDIIAENDDYIVCVEVKARSSSYFGNPQEFVTRKKVQQLVKAMHEYMQTKEVDKEVRFDIIAVMKNKEKLAIEHLENAFYHF
ncbi:YraN family protein [Ascidiimonas aurantiaca]|uniref:YraN family protein n=1 Tax=Ascidiimonas aurantiaca TaxID=1685432 RepID=UPI0030EB1AD3